MGNLTASSFLVALSGIVIVFIMLAVLCLMIPIISKVVISLQKPVADSKQTEIVKAEKTENNKTEITAVTGDVKLIDVDEKTAACVMAIVSHETGIPLSELIFKSIKAI